MRYVPSAAVSVLGCSCSATEMAPKFLVPIKRREGGKRFIIRWDSWCTVKNQCLQSAGGTYRPSLLRWFVERATRGGWNLAVLHIQRKGLLKTGGGGGNNNREMKGRKRQSHDEYTIVLTVTMRREVLNEYNNTFLRQYDIMKGFANELKEFLLFF